MTPNTLPDLPVTGRVLLVDDSEAVTRCVSSYLETYGHSVVQENSPFRAHSTARREKPDVIVLDIKMPGRDGGSVLEQIREDAEIKHTPVIFLTGLMTADETGDGLERDGCIFLSKQAKFSVLLRLVNRMLAARTAAVA